MGTKYFMVQNAALLTVPGSHRITNDVARTLLTAFMQADSLDFNNLDLPWPRDVVEAGMRELLAARVVRRIDGGGRVYVISEETHRVVFARDTGDYYSVPNERAVVDGKPPKMN